VIMGVSVSTVRNHVARGLARLRGLLKVRVDG
jgi:DNA-directed RNA polymerase specialized sigma24 family protein